jgi:UMF1 family MFS transporter
MDFVSSLGFAFGYLGGGVLFGVNMIMVMKPAIFGIADAAQAVRLSFLLVAAWWLLFSVPALMFVKYRRYAHVTGARAIVADSLRRLSATAAKIVRRRELLYFLIAYWLYYDGVVTFIKMATDFGLSIGFPARTVMIALLAVQFVAFPASLLFGAWAGRFGARRVIITGIFIYLIVIIFGVLFLTKPAHFIFFACLTGLAQGGIQALSRSFFGKLVPPQEATEYFGFYNVVGRMAIIGPAIVGVTAQVLYRLGMESVLASRIGMATTAILFIAGGFMLITAAHARTEAQERA